MMIKYECLRPQKKAKAKKYIQNIFSEEIFHVTKDYLNMQIWEPEAINEVYVQTIIFVFMFCSNPNVSPPD